MQLADHSLLKVFSMLGMSLPSLQLQYRSLRLSSAPPSSHLQTRHAQELRSTPISASRQSSHRRQLGAISTLLVESTPFLTKDRTGCISSFSRPSSPPSSALGKLVVRSCSRGASNPQRHTSSRLTQIAQEKVFERGKASTGKARSTRQGPARAASPTATPTTCERRLTGLPLYDVNVNG